MGIIEKIFGPRRKTKLKEISTNLGFTFQEKPSKGILEILEDFEVIKSKPKSEIRNLLSIGKESKIDAVDIFDYRTKEGKASTKQTIILLTSKDLQLPQFKIKPVRFSNVVKALFDRNLIEKIDDKKFDDRFLISGLKPSEVKKVITPEFKNILYKSNHYTLEGMNYFLMLYSDNELLPAKSSIYENRYYYIYDLANALLNKK